MHHRPKNVTAVGILIFSQKQFLFVHNQSSEPSATAVTTSASPFLIVAICMSNI